MLSCAALLKRDAPLDVVTVFGGEPDPPRLGYWDEICGFASSKEALAVRRAEQAAAFAGSQHRVSSLPVLERQYVDERTPADRRAIGVAAAEWANRNPGGLVALPAGAGWTAPALVRRVALLAGRVARIRPHPEHEVVRDSALAMLDAGWTPLLYEELPYLEGGSADSTVARIARRHGLRATPLEQAVDRAAKAARIAFYASQVPRISAPGRRLDDPEALPAFERYWLLEP
ncbi:MAG: hypothetical protein H0V79_11235 [Actinobacteria bacterium]|nr:hypothetical protein [Actinomycetota bacterium]